MPSRNGHAGSARCRRFPVGWWNRRPSATTCPVALTRGMAQRHLGVGLLAAAMLVLSGCDRAEEDRAAKAAADAVRKSNQALAEAGQAMSKAGEAAREGAGEAAGLAKDATLTARVKTALLADEAVPASRIDVDSSAGVVTLSGQLASDEQIRRAVEITRKVEGVERVESRLTKG